LKLSGINNDGAENLSKLLRITLKQYLKDFQLRIEFLNEDASHYDGEKYMKLSK
jgi:hypothetical protein